MGAPLKVAMFRAACNIADGMRGPVISLAEKVTFDNLWMMYFPSYSMIGLLQQNECVVDAVLEMKL
jgi:hypothetical protein